jgi:hypothetical protein
VKTVKENQIGKITDILCSFCKRSTHHKILSSIDTSGFEEWGNGEGINWSETDQILQCQGCSNISFRRKTSNSEDMDENGYVISTEIFPKTSIEIMKFDLSHNVPFEIKRIFNESLDCYKNGDFILCAVGIRAVIEGICKDKNIKSGLVNEKDRNNKIVQRRKYDLRGKINGLYDVGILTRKNAEYLHQHRFLGNDAIHELKTPSSKELMLAIEIAYSIMQNIYDLPIKVIELKKARTKKK